MKGFVRTLFLGAALIISSQAFAGQISVRIGPPPSPRVEHMTHRPGPDYVWVEGYWYPAGNHYRWHQGYWTRAPYAGANWVGPRWEGGQYETGHWEGSRGRIEHDHRWDRNHDRDYHEHERYERYGR
jgi:hypothetical protein